jgi:hypothetical protein
MAPSFERKLPMGPADHRRARRALTTVNGIEVDASARPERRTYRARVGVLPLKI